MLQHMRIRSGWWVCTALVWLFAGCGGPEDRPAAGQPLPTAAGIVGAAVQPEASTAVQPGTAVQPWVSAGPWTGRVPLANLPLVDFQAGPSSGELLGLPAPLAAEGLESSGPVWKLKSRGLVRIPVAHRGEIQLVLRGRSPEPQSVLQVRWRSRVLATLRFDDPVLERKVRTNANFPTGVQDLELEWTGQQPLELESVRFQAKRPYGLGRLGLSRFGAPQEPVAGDDVDAEDREHQARQYRDRTLYVDEVREGIRVSLPGSFGLRMAEHGAGTLLVDLGVASVLPAGAIRFTVTSGRAGEILSQRIELGKPGPVWHPIQVPMQASGPDLWTFRVEPLELEVWPAGLLPELVRVGWGRPRFLLGDSRSRPDVIVVSCDTLRADRLGAWGAARQASPNLDRLTRQSLLLRQTISPAPWTLPSYATLLTSLPPAVHGAGAQILSGKKATASLLRQDVPTWAEVFSRSGYSTLASVGSPLLSPRLGLLRGFEATTHYRYFSGPVTQELVQEILQTPLTEPVFLFVQYMEPHAPYFPPSPLDRAFGEAPKDSVIGDYARRKHGMKPQLLGPEDRQRILDLYDAEVLTFDQRLGTLIQALQQRGAERTILAMHADHGEEFWDHGGFEHGHSLHAELLDIPSFLWAPGRLSPGIHAAPAAAADLLATASRLAGIPATIGQGQDLLASPEKPAVAARAFFSGSLLYGPPQKSVQQGGWKLIVPEAAGASQQLYGLAGDPGEHRNLQPTEAQQASALAGLFERGTEAPDPSATPVAADPELEESMRALGYID